MTTDLDNLTLEQRAEVLLMTASVCGGMTRDMIVDAFRTVRKDAIDHAVDILHQAGDQYVSDGYLQIADEVYRCERRVRALVPKKHDDAR
jgi:hypothetical protein